MGSTFTYDPFRPPGAHRVQMFVPNHPFFQEQRIVKSPPAAPSQAANSWAAVEPPPPPAVALAESEPSPEPEPPAPVSPAPIPVVVSHAYGYGGGSYAPSAPVAYPVGPPQVAASAKIASALRPPGAKPQQTCAMG
ncbi:MAG: hypothetical protein ACM3UP_02085 [Methanocella sp.]